MVIFNVEYLWSFIRDTDFDLDPIYGSAGGKLQLAADAAKMAGQGFKAFNLKTHTIKGRTVYQVTDAPALVLLRALNECLVQATGIIAADRDTIIRRLKTVLGEGVQHRIHKLDVRRFFESIDVPSLIASIMDDPRIPRAVSILIRRLFEEFGSLGVAGVPRGIPLSGTLAEYVLQSFDMSASREPDVYFYARFVDDIVVVTGARQTEKAFRRTINKWLPQGLQFNDAKSDCITLGVDRKGTGVNRLGEFDFLGYSFQLYDTTKARGPLSRPVSVTISAKKLRRIKTRVCRSFATFVKDGDILALKRRLQMLTGNFNVRDGYTRQNRNVGLFCNYRRATSTENLKEVDALVRSIALGGTSALALGVRAKLSAKKRRELLVFNFHKSFSERPFYNFTPAEKIKLTRCWQHD